MLPVMSIRPPEELRRALRVIAMQRGITINALVISIFWDYVTKEKRGK